MQKTIGTILISTVLGALLGSYITVNSFDSLPWAKSGDFQTVIKREVIDSQENAVINVVNKVSPSVVSIVIEKDISQNRLNDPFSDFFNDWPFFYQAPSQQPESTGPNYQKVGGGSGFIISANGYILTNKHVVSDVDAKYKVVLNDGREFEASVVGTDLFNDIGALKIEASDLPVVELGNSDDLVIGQSVVAIGNALAEFSNTVTTGVVSGISRTIVASDGSGSSEELEDVIQTDAAINPGNSGGPLLNLSGQVIGINTAISREGQLIGFAIPINSAKSVIDSVIKNGEIVRPYLGVRYMMLNKDIAQKNNLEITEGALIVRGDDRTELAVVPGSPADKAGLRENDIVLEINGAKLNQDLMLAEAIAQYSPGDKIKLKVWSRGEEKELELTLDKYKQ